MKSREFFEAFCRTLEHAQEPAAQLRSGDLEVFLRAKEILQVCYEGNTGHDICSALQRRACAIMLDVSDPSDWAGALNVYGAAWRLSNVLPDPGGEEAAAAAARSSNASQQSETEVVLQQQQVLQHHLGLLDSELDIQLVVVGGTNVAIESLQNQLEALRRSLVLITDIAASGVGYSDYFGMGAAGVRTIERISASLMSAIQGAQNIELSEEARGLIQKVAIGVRDLMRSIAVGGTENTALTDCLIKFEKNIEPYLVTVQTAHREGVFKDIDAPWCPEMISIPPGEYLMGSNDPAHQDEMPQHQVRIGGTLAVGCCPVTFEEYDAYCQETKSEKPSDNGWGRQDRPVINVSWNDAQGYVAWLSGKTGHQYRLLSEAEWEYACRAGSTTRYYFGDNDSNLAAHAWYVGNLEGETRPVGKRLANDFGLFDMLGNVWEWCTDVWHPNYSGTPPQSGGAWNDGGVPQNRVLRGGSWVSSARGIRSAVRSEGATDYRNNNVGFRVARSS